MVMSARSEANNENYDFSDLRNVKIEIYESEMKQNNSTELSGPFFLRFTMKMTPPKKTESIVLQLSTQIIDAEHSGFWSELNFFQHSSCKLRSRLFITFACTYANTFAGTRAITLPESVP